MIKSKIDHYGVVAMQTEVKKCDSRSEIIENNLQPILDGIDFTMQYWNGMFGVPTKFIGLPEFSICGFPQNDDGTWNGVYIDLPGKETDLLARKAMELDVYIGAHAWTVYEGFPHPFSVAFIISPQGEIILKHHKVVTTKVWEAGSASPMDAYDFFVDKFGDDLNSFFPVVETEIGNIGCQICGEGLYPEISRGLMMNGCELIYRPNAWVEPALGPDNDEMSLISRFNAMSNVCYLVEPNWVVNELPSAWHTGNGKSQVIDYHGRTLARTSSDGITSVGADINMANMRRYRQLAQAGSRLDFIPSQIFKKVYEKEIWPKNSLKDIDMHYGHMQWEVIRQQVVEDNPEIFTPVNDEMA